MTTTTSTTISGVSLITRQGARAPERFEIVLSAGGIDFRRAKRPGARLTWDRITEWAIEEREGDVVLTLQGGDGTTPLLIPGWSTADLAVLLRQLTGRPAEAKAASTPAQAKTQTKKAPPVKKAPQAKKAPPVKKPAPAKKAAQAKKAPPVKKPAQTKEAVVSGTDDGEGPRPGVVELPATDEGAAGGAAAVGATAAAKAEVSDPATPQHTGQVVPWKVVVAIALLGVLATAVTIVLLQSAGIIDWSFLGPNI
jgi:hypothetical protein